MYEKYMICDETLHNIESDGQVTGYAFDVRMPYYRALRLSMVEPFDLVVDGDPVERSDLTLTVNDVRYTFDQLADETTAAWGFGDRALLTVQSPGGLAAGEHLLDLTERLRISYIPTVAVARATKTATIQA